MWVEPVEKLDIIDAVESGKRHLECATVDNAKYTITGDDHLLGLGEYEGIVILTPTTFVTL